MGIGILSSLGQKSPISSAMKPLVSPLKDKRTSEAVSVEPLGSLERTPKGLRLKGDSHKVQGRVYGADLSGKRGFFTLSELDKSDGGGEIFGIKSRIDNTERTDEVTNIKRRSFGGMVYSDVYMETDETAGIQYLYGFKRKWNFSAFGRVLSVGREERYLIGKIPLYGGSSGGGGGGEDSATSVYYWDKEHRSFKNRYFEANGDIYDGPNWNGGPVPQGIIGILIQRSEPAEIRSFPTLDDVKREYTHSQDAVFIPLYEFDMTGEIVCDLRRMPRADMWAPFSGETS